MRLRNIKSTILHDEEEHKIRGDDNVGQRLFDGIKLSPNAAKRNHFKIYPRLCPQDQQSHRQAVFLTCLKEVLDIGCKLVARQVTKALDAHNGAEAKHKYEPIECPLFERPPQPV